MLSTHVKKDLHIQMPSMTFWNFRDNILKISRGLGWWNTLIYKGIRPLMVGQCLQVDSRVIPRKSQRKAILKLAFYCQTIIQVYGQKKGLLLNIRRLKKLITQTYILSVKKPRKQNLNMEFRKL